MFSFRASFWNTDVYINGQEKYAANEILTAHLNKADELLRIPWIGDLKRLRHDLMIDRKRALPGSVGGQWSTTGSRTTTAMSGKQ